jgi:3-oxoacyl-[acyl-carrier protein] reductase
MGFSDEGVVSSLAGKTALITGGSRGIGAATVRLFAQAGARVAFNYRQANREAEALVEECGAERCIAIQQELSAPAEGRTLVEKAVVALGGLDILVANHGIWPPDYIGINDMPDSHWQRTLDVNLNSVFGLIQGAVAQMRKQAKQPDAGAKTGDPGGEPSGHIVLISSTSGQRGEAFHADYSVTKSALISLTKSLSAELAPDRIRVNCVAPGWVETDMSIPATNDPVKGAEIRATIPLRRPGTPEEIAGPILFLCTPHAGFMNGSVMSVNGGAVLVG